MSKRICIFDTTLSDGEQSPGATMTCEEKIMIADALDAMGINVIEAGFAFSSPGDFNCIKQLLKNEKCCGLQPGNNKRN